MRKLFSFLMIAVFLFSLTCFMSSCTNQSTPSATFEENIVGRWESKKEGTNNKATIEFVYENGSLKGTHNFYDYDNSEWGELSFDVGERTEYTMTLLYEDGTMKVVSYSMAKDTLVFDKIIYKNTNKNIIINPDTETHMIDGVPMPIRAGIYLGMTQSEVSMMADTEYGHTSEYSWETVVFYELPDFFYPQIKGGYTAYTFDTNGKLVSHEFSFYPLYDSDKEKLPELKDNILDVYSEMYGDYYIYEWTDDQAGTVSYTFTVGNMGIEVVAWKDGDITIKYSLDVPDYKLGIE